MCAILTRSKVGSDTCDKTLQALGLTKLHTLITTRASDQLIGKLKRVRKNVVWTILADSDSRKLPEIAHLCPPKGGFPVGVNRTGYLEWQEFKKYFLCRYRLC